VTSKFKDLNHGIAECLLMKKNATEELIFFNLVAIIEVPEAGLENVA
jgi:hypothetical protein